ncbi:uncharacterized protein SETTUDRAFT_162563, partial [Exserohilum turcica Et28A]
MAHGHASGGTNPSHRPLSGVDTRHDHSRNGHSRNGLSGRRALKIAGMKRVTGAKGLSGMQEKDEQDSTGLKNDGEMERGMRREEGYAHPQDEIIAMVQGQVRV